MKTAPSSLTPKILEQEAKIRQFAEVAENIFAPAYPVVAKQILKTVSLNRGLALDIGTGSGLLAHELSRQSDLRVVALDNKLKMLAIAQETLKQKDDLNKIYLCAGDAIELPFRNGSFDLVVSRGSFFFWQDKIKGLKEVHRVLRFGGKAMIGGGFGTKEIKQKIASQVKAVYPDWEERVKKRFKKFSKEKLSALTMAAGITKAKIIHDEANIWIVFQK